MNNKKIKQTILFLVDLSILFISLKITLILRYADELSPEIEEKHFQIFIPVFLLWLMIFYINSLYDFKKIINQNKLIERSIKSALISFFLSMILFYLVPYAQITPKTNLLIFASFSFVLFTLWRLLFLSINKKYLPGSNIAMIGYNEIIRKTIQAIKKNPQLGYNVKFLLSEKNNVLVDIADIYDLKIVEDANQLSRAIKDYKIDSLILEKDLGEMKDLQKTLFNLLPSGINYYNLINFYEEISGQIPLEILNKAWFLENLNLAEKRTFEGIKRIFDLFLSFFFLIFAFPLSIIIAILIKITSHGPVMFKQTRSGKNNKDFNLYKFRTMRVEKNNHAPTEENDPRITVLGKFLRKSRIDEIPQLLNVLRGDMSFVGPRPERPEIIKELANNIPFYSVRSLVKPGISGWDQISGEYHSPSVEDTYKKLQYDLFYIKNRSFYLDISIILKTIKTALGQEGR
ncbi:sugar transferase [Candidatus Falkowbacteria bacterium HGW-Falkowbacteria-1]|uniref:Sugar transferase n=1 Tax=Candidatus Falkowbacteria bacterium HGW-Falkowbacteria-1 TaxID=2013768 RepID=A0A2N2EAX6_9BACT|nr:MAG: sugar transferase [Candidatus Falkowbacteria bacterium HGW-Falkowbacteria-1]